MLNRWNCPMWLLMAIMWYSGGRSCLLKLSEMKVNGLKWKGGVWGKDEADVAISPTVVQSTIYSILLVELLPASLQSLSELFWVIIVSTENWLMAEALSYLEEDLTCLICCDIFTDPVTLKCSHSLCEECLQRFWRTQDVPQCPVCCKKCSHDEPTKSLAFRALCESSKKRKPTAVSGDVCPEHKEALKLFCFEDQQPICVVCYTSKKHENHKCSPVDEAAGNLKVGVWNLIWLTFGIFKLNIKSLLCDSREISRHSWTDFRRHSLTSRKPKRAAWNRLSSLRYVLVRCVSIVISSEDLHQLNKGLNLLKPF